MVTGAGYDYVNLNGTTLYFGREDYVKCFNITTLDDGVIEGNETFSLTFSIYPDVNYTFIGPEQAILHIIDNDGTYTVYTYVCVHSVYRQGLIIDNDGTYTVYIHVRMCALCV